MRLKAASRDASVAMTRIPRPLAAVLAIGLALAVGVRGDEKTPYTGPACGRAVDAFFKDEVWTKVGAPSCLTCHTKGGDAEDSKFLLRDPRKEVGAAQDEALRHNRDAFARM